MKRSALFIIIGSLFLLIVLAVIGIVFFLVRQNPTGNIAAMLPAPVKELLLSDQAEVRAVQAELVDTGIDTALGLASGDGVAGQLVQLEEGTQVNASNQQTINSMKYELQITAETEGGDQSQALAGSGINMTATGSALVEPDSQQSNTNIVGELDILGTALSFDVDVKSLDDEAYFYINSFPGIGFLPGGQDLIRNWILVDEAALAENGLNLELNNELGDNQNNITQEDIDKFKEFIQSETITKNTKPTDTKEIKGNAVSCYLTDLDADASAKLTKEIEQIFGEDQANITSNSKQLQNTFEFCLGQQDKLPYKLAFSNKTEAGDSGAITTTNFTGIMYDFNQAVEVSAPSDYQNLSDILDELQLDGMGGQSQPAVPSPTPTPTPSPNQFDF